MTAPLRLRLLNPISARYTLCCRHLPPSGQTRCPLCRRGFTKRRYRMTCERCNVDICPPCYWKRVATPREFALFNAGGNDLRTAELLGYPDEQTKKAEALLGQLIFLCPGCRS